MATRPAQMREWRGEDRRDDDCVTDPLLAISHRLILGEQNIHRPTWHEVVAAEGISPLVDYAKLVRTKRVFAIGGLQLVIECGLVNDWYRNDANRLEALRLIETRGHRALLDKLGDKDPEGGIFGKNDLRGYFSYFPQVRRTNGSQAVKEPPGPRTIRKEFPLRLRKALEFLFLTEAVLRWRFDIKETGERFRELTGHTVTGPDDARLIWKYMWIEPLLFVLDPLPREPDVARIGAQELANTDRFRDACGQHPSVLGSILRGVPGSHNVTAAAAAACDRFYTPHAASTAVVSVPYAQHDKRLDRLQDNPLFKEGAAAIENIVQLTPHP